MFYVSRIKEYPIYEPAEGGYYYAGESVEISRAFKDWKKANRFFQVLRRGFLEEYGGDPSRICDVPCGGVGKHGGPFVSYFSRYIGNGDRVEIAREKPKPSGWQPYC